MLTLVALSCAAQAAAHHPGAPSGPGSLAPRSRVGLELAAAEIDLPATGGLWRLMTLRFEHAFFERFSIGAEIPLGQVSYDDGHDEAGPADVSLGAHVLLFSVAHDTFAGIAGFSVELPTGEYGTGLGDGHFMGTPEVGLMFVAHPQLLLTFQVSDHFAIGDGDAHPPEAPEAATTHTRDPPKPIGVAEEEDEAQAAAPATIGSVIAPHSAHELTLRLGAIASYDILYAGAGVSAIAMFEGDEHLGPVSADAGLGASPLDAWTLGVGLAIPFAGERRLSWRAGVHTEVRF